MNNICDYSLTIKNKIVKNVAGIEYKGSHFLSVFDIQTLHFPILSRLIKS